MLLWVPPKEKWGCTNRAMIWSRDPGHQYTTDSNPIGFAAKNLFVLTCALQNHRCAQCFGYFELSPITDETGCAMVFLLPWCDFPLPDETFPYRRCAMGMMWLFPAWSDFYKYGACRIFHEINHPAIGVLHLWKPPMGPTQKQLINFNKKPMTPPFPCTERHFEAMICWPNHTWCYYPLVNIQKTMENHHL